jgi:hypothetical protein
LTKIFKHGLLKIWQLEGSSGPLVVGLLNKTGPTNTRKNTMYAYKTGDHQVLDKIISGCRELGCTLQTHELLTYIGTFGTAPFHNDGVLSSWSLRPEHVEKAIEETMFGVVGYGDRLVEEIALSN